MNEMNYETNISDDSGQIDNRNALCNSTQLGILSRFQEVHILRIPQFHLVVLYVIYKRHL